MTPAILTDVTKCIGCEECVAACVGQNGLANYMPKPQDRGDGLSSQRFCSVLVRPGNAYVRKQCRHCLHPACVSACPVGAMQVSPEGPVVYDPNLCMGCRYCMMACPYGIPRYDWDEPVPFVRKCSMCYDRIRTGEEPACTEACPEEATIFGDREELIAEAERRLGAEPKYVQRVYGKDEVGGTSVIYISDVELGFLGLQEDLPKEPLPDLTWRVMKTVPHVAIAMGAAMVGIHWVIGRRIKHAAQGTEEEPATGAEEHPVADTEDETDE